MGQRKLTYQTAATVASDGTLTIKELPFHPGDEVEVVVRSLDDQPDDNERYPLRGKPVRYQDPFGSVSEDDWEVTA